MISKRLLTFALAILAVVAVPAIFQQRARSQSAKYLPVARYDPKRDAAQDIRDAVAEATRANKRILLEVGGDWCSWCHRLDEFFESHPDLTALREKNFVTVKINFSEENPNKEVLSRYDVIPGYPHIFLLDSDGSLLRSQGTSFFESGKSYDLAKLTTFLTEWAPRPID